jgi:hypothetical protein
MNGLLAWNIDTCTGNAPDSLFGGVITLPLNGAGMALLAWKPRPVPMTATVAVPALLAIPYAWTTAALTHGYLERGMGACDMISQYGPWEPSGDEFFLIVLWLAAAAVFWLGLALAGSRAYRSAERDEIVEQAS